MSRFFLFFSLICLTSLTYALDDHIREQINQLVLMDMQGITCPDSQQNTERVTPMASDRAMGLAAQTSILRPLSPSKQSGPKLRMVQKMPQHK
ncbi:hypothetical protein [Candidatus Similichlamydia laticola]|uniref:Secreted protein n=1 Tax=Candidatus Similichlamydia laticola TaxID=2170265 RepID=A0A369KCW5_9BACT|nr:hypothetical protein [Candidatus Similichlamydia laticola]RDB31300.1 hypothetical protein HAT2_00597 [Candidatus Similichlamydia laticola]